MKCILFLLCFISVNVFAQSNQKAQMYEQMASRGNVHVGKKFGKFQGTSNQNTFFDNASLEGKVTFVNIWFRNCPPCIAEMDPLRRLYERYKKDTNFVFLSLTFESPEVIEKAVEEFKMEYPIVSISSKECAELNFRSGYPTNMVLDHTGTIQKFMVGGSTDHDEVQEFFNMVYSSKIRELIRKVNKKKK